MRLLRFIPIKLTLVVILGIVAGNYLNLDVRFPLFACIILLVLLGFLRFKDKKNESHSFGYLAILTTFCIGLFAAGLAQPKNQTNHYLNTDFSGNHIWHIKISEALKPSSYSERYIGKVQALDQNYAEGKVLLSFSNDSMLKKLQVDDEVVLFSSIDEVKAPLNPHQFNYKNYLKDLGIFHQFRLTSSQFITLDSPSTTIYGIAANARTHIISQLKKADFGQEELSIIQALLLGQRNDISEETYTDYKNAGAVHILAVSGLHIGILLWILLFLLKPLERLPRGKTLKLVLTVLLLWGFAFLSGLSASVVRSVTMFSFVAYSMYLNRPNNTFNILALSIFFILLAINPNLLFQAGFQMSYAAVLAIVWLYPLFQKLWFPKHKLVRKIWQLLSVSIAAQLGVLPISLFYFHQFPGLFFISNLLIVPGLGIILGMGILVIFLALIGQLCGELVIIYNALIGWMNQIIHWVAQQEAFIFKNISFDGVQMVLAYTILFSCVILFTRPNFKKAIALATFIVGFQLWTIYTDYETARKNILFIGHQTKNTVVVHQNGHHTIAATRDTLSVGNMLNDYSVAERTTNTTYSTVKNSYKWENKNVLIIDSLGVYPTRETSVDYLILTQSPKLNLERVISSIRPKNIIVDGSNYTSYVNRWKETCLKQKLPFHATGEKGAYYFD
ncbi:ComEC/Rec2 family competence protein [Zobellia russellii]|uniref:ComEC/Rec2 family competence protein n=1 Tax=Zobellia russellii TaxID=248907 RepID=UPI001BFF66C0|nr:ComEC/Rec2 family competence protein [Zobellia russellii]MBT9187455.1 ComEC/Rec2 family competence protein [Zobellia russellii]